MLTKPWNASVSHATASERECWLKCEICVFGGSLDIELFSEKIFIRVMSISFLSNLNVLKNYFLVIL